MLNFDLSQMLAGLGQQNYDQQRDSLLTRAFSPNPEVQAPPQSQGGFDLQRMLAGLADALSATAAAKGGGAPTSHLRNLEELRQFRANREQARAERDAAMTGELSRDKASTELRMLESERERTLMAGQRQSERLYQEGRDRAAGQAKKKEEDAAAALRKELERMGNESAERIAKMGNDARQEISDLRKTIADDKAGRAKLDEQDKILAATRQEALDIKRIGRLNPDGKTRTPVKPEELAAAKADFLDDAEAAGLEGPHLRLAEEWWDRKVGAAPEAGPAPPPTKDRSMFDWMAPQKPPMGGQGTW